jgi:anti-sigma regulatory factor (Ser/Thr protein kinase)
MMEKLERRWRIARNDQRGGAEARREFRNHLLRCRAPDDSGLHEALVVFGELVTNAVRCARSEVLVELAADHSTILRVIDDGDCFGVGRVGQSSTEAEGGRGLHIAKALSRELTVEHKPPGCVVTAVLPLSSAAL